MNNSTGALQAPVGATLAGATAIPPLAAPAVGEKILLSFPRYEGAPFYKVSGNPSMPFQDGLELIEVEVTAVKKVVITYEDKTEA